MENTQSNLSIQPLGQAYLLETAKWAKFLAIMGFVSIGLIVLAGFFLGTSVGSLGVAKSGLSVFSGIAVAGLYLLIALFYFIPCWYLYKMSQKMNLAIHTQNEDELTWAFENQKKLFKFMGVITLIGLMFNLGAVFFVLLGGGLGMLMR